MTERDRYLSGNTRSVMTPGPSEPEPVCCQDPSQSGYLAALSSGHCRAHLSSLCHWAITNEMLEKLCLASGNTGSGHEQKFDRELFMNY